MPLRRSVCGELKELLKFIMTNKAESETARLVADAVSDKKTKEITKGGWGMLEDEMRKAERKGERKGEINKAIETAKNLIKMGLLTLEQIAQGTGLSLEEVKRLSVSL